MNPRRAVIAAALVGVVSGCSSSGGTPSRTGAVIPTTLRPATVTSLSSTAAPVPSQPVAARSTTTSTPAATASRTARATTTSAATDPKASAAACPGGLASELAYTGSARQLITVVAEGWETSTASVELWQRQGGCWVQAGGPWNAMIGENGFADHHIEGDGTTPTGMYGLGPVIYGNAPDPGVREPYHQLVCGDWWDEDPSSPGYNTFQHVPCGEKPQFDAGSEALWQETAPYPSFAVIDYNTGPIVKGAGSAIFLHADTGSPTSGCVSIPLADLDQTLRWLDPGDSPAFVMGPSGEITRF